jgi:hypothetical protein
MQVQHCARDLVGRIAIHNAQDRRLTETVAAEQAEETEHG